MRQGDAKPRGREQKQVGGGLAPVDLLATGHLGGRALHLLGRPAEQALARDLRVVPRGTGSRLDREFRQRLEQVHGGTGFPSPYAPRAPEPAAPRPVGGGSGPPAGAGGFLPDDPLGLYRSHPPFPGQWSGSKLSTEDSHEGLAFARQHLAGTAPRLTGQEADALHTYTTPWYREINQALRDGHAGGDAQAGRRSIAPSPPSTGPSQEPTRWTRASWWCARRR